MYLLPYRASDPRASVVGMRRPLYSTMNAPFLISAVAKRPSPVFDRPTWNGFRGMGGHYTPIGGESNDRSPGRRQTPTCGVTLDRGLRHDLRRAIFAPVLACRAARALRRLAVCALVRRA